MRISFEWLREFADVDVPVSEVADRLTMAGLEIEGIEAVQDDVVLEVNVTPNRPDCLSVIGIAREVAAAFRLPLKMPPSSVTGKLPPSPVGVEVLDPELCNRYAGRYISGVKISESPGWMKSRLEKSGIRSLNNIVDVTNYVLLELGHPLHAFDADKLRESVIRVGKAGRGSAITTLDGCERKLPEETLLILDGKGPVAVAGVMGGGESGVSGSTVNVFLESAYFKPGSVRKTSKALGLRTESSYRFERGTDIEFLERALDRAALLIRELAGGVISEIVDVYPLRYTAPEVTVSFKRVNSLLGTGISNDDMLFLLNGIGIRTEGRGEIFVAFPPAYRRDIREAIDIVEEVARLHGYGNIPARVPKSPLSRGGMGAKEEALSWVRDSLRKTGFSEVINYSFMSSGDLDLIDIPAGDERRRSLAIKNPLRQEDALMRTTLTPALIRNFMHNLSRGLKDVRLYELSRVFVDAGGQLPEEKTRLAGIFYSERKPSIWAEDAHPFFLVKGALQALLGELKIGGETYVPSAEAFLHKGKSADVVAGKLRLGYLGELAPGIVERLDLKIQKPSVVVFELDVDRLLALIPERVLYSPLPKYPAVERDIAVIVDERIAAAEVLDYLEGFNSEEIESVDLFDHYKGKSIPEGRKSLAFRIVYRHSERTLIDAEVEVLHKALVEHVLAKTGGELRGSV